MENSDYIELVSEIFQGYTELTVKGRSVFLRHISLQDQAKLSALIEKLTEEKIALGMSSEKDRLEFLKKEKLWGENDDLEIVEKENYVSNLSQTKKKVALPSQQKAIQKEIDEETAKLNLLRAKKRELIGPMTAEDFAAKEANEKFIRSVLYTSSSFSELAFSQSDFDELSDEELFDVYNQYQRTMERLSDENIQKAVLQDFFSSYIGFCDKSMDFFGKPIINCSSAQRSLLIWGRCFLNIFQNVEKIPDSIRKDPKALLDFADNSRNREKVKNNSKGKEGSTSFVMGTKEDAEALSDGATIGNLADELKSSGGFLSQNDLLKRAGVRV